MCQGTDDHREEMERKLKLVSGGSSPDEVEEVKSPPYRCTSCTLEFFIVTQDAPSLKRSYAYCPQCGQPLWGRG